MRVFLDTNVLASALTGHGLCRDLLNRLVIGHTVLLGVPVLDELHRILVSKFRVPENLWDELALRLREFEQVPAADAPRTLAIPDPDDVPIIACALAAHADVIVTGDRALLKLRSIDGVPVMTPRQLWLKLGAG